MIYINNIPTRLHIPKTKQPRFETLSDFFRYLLFGGDAGTPIFKAGTIVAGGANVNQTQTIDGGRATTQYKEPLVLRLVNSTTFEVYNIPFPNNCGFAYNFIFNTPNLQSGQYQYFILNDGVCLDSGLAIIGQYRGKNKVSIYNG